MIEGSIKIGELEIRVQDEQIMAFFPGDEGTSEPLDFGVIRRLSALTGLASAHLSQMITERDHYPYPSLQESHAGKRSEPSA